MPDTRVGLIGYGLGGAVFHAPLVAATPGLTLATIVTSDPERSAAAAERYPQARLVASADALFARAADLDVAIVTTPNITHVPLARRALDSGLHVVVDKPMAPTAAEAQALVAHAQSRGRLVVPFHNRRWDGDFLTIRALLEKGVLGRVHRFESRFERWRPVPKPGWRQDAAPEAAGGVLYDLGSHLIDQALVLFGPAAFVYAELEARAPGGVDDDAFVAIAHASGVRSHLWMSAMAAIELPRFRVLGSRGGCVKRGLDGQEEALKAGRVPGTPGWGEAGVGENFCLKAEGTETLKRGAYQEFYAGLARAIRDGAPVPVDPADAVAGLRVIELARRAAAEMRVVRAEAAI